MLHICKTMHDSVKSVVWFDRGRSGGFELLACVSCSSLFSSALTLEDEKRSLALLIVGFVRTVRPWKRLGRIRDAEV